MGSRFWLQNVVDSGITCLRGYQTCDLMKTESENLMSPSYAIVIAFEFAVPCQADVCESANSSRAYRRSGDVAVKPTS